MKAYTSRSRFDESRNFTGVYQQMGRVGLDSDWNEEVRIRTADVRRRTHDLAFGSPDEGFAIGAEHLLDAVTSLDGWSGNGLLPGDLRVIPPRLTLDRREPEGLPYVVCGQGHVRIERRFGDGSIDLTRATFDPAEVFAVSALVFSVRFERPPNDDDPTDVRFFVVDGDGAEVSVPAQFGQELPSLWTEQRVGVAELAGLDITRIAGWGVTGLPPRARTFIAGLECTDAAIPDTGVEFVVRGGDGSLPFAGRMFVDGARVCLRRDVRYSSQPDFPDPPTLAALPADGTLAHVVYLDVWEQLVTALDDPFLHEPALDGLDTTVRLRTRSQVKVAQSTEPSAPVRLPAPTGAGRLSTNVAAGAFPDRYTADPIDPCRDRCLFTESASTGEGYTGSQNLHLRVEILSVEGLRPVFGWSRDNGATRIPLTADAPSDATSLAVSSEDALRLRAGDVVVISDARIELHPEGVRKAVLRVVKSSDPATSTVTLHPTFALSETPDVLSAGGPLGETFRVVDRAFLRRWDGADWLLPNVRYNLPDGIALAFGGSGFRVNEYWSFTARVHNADGVSRGAIEQLTNAPVHGPVHHYVALSRVTRQATGLVFEDLRPRFLPLNAVRDRLAELAREDVSRGAFTLTVGDGVRTFGDIDQNLLEGVTADEALQSAVNTLRSAGGGTLYIRAGNYRLEKPVLVSECSRLRILGDGDASELRVVGAGGAFLIDGCGNDGEVGVELLSLVEAPLEDSVIGLDAETLPAPGEEVQPLEPGDLVRASPTTPSFAQNVVASALAPERLSRRALNSVRATLEEVRRLQRANPGQPVEDLPAAAPLLSALRSLPHGVVTVGDSRSVRLQRLRIQSREPLPEASGIFITGTCDDVLIRDCSIEAAAGIVAIPYAPYLSRTFLARNVRSGLDLRGVRLVGNDIRPIGRGVHGIYVAEGRLSNLSVTDNRIEGFVVGVVLQSTAASVGGERGLLSRNTITACTGLGIEVFTNVVDVEQNSVQGAQPAGRVWGGIRVRGVDVRVRGCDVTLPRTALDASPLNTVAGIIVGGGVEEGEVSAYRGFGATQDVDVASCRVNGPGAVYPGVGVLIGGPDPVLDVRVRDGEFRNLGDAAIRGWGHGGKVGRVFIGGNRIDEVAQAAVPATRDVTAALAELAPQVSAELAAAGVSRTDPAAMLRSLLASNGPDVVVALDALLRWVSLRTLRAAIALDQALEVEVSDNRIHEVGRDGATSGDNVTTAAIAVVGGADVTVERNHVENVIGEVVVLDAPGGPSQPSLPAALQTLDELGLAFDDRRASRSDVHVATTALRRLLVSYAGGDDAARQRLGRRIYAAMDALVDDLDALGGAGSKIASSLALEADQMRTAQGRDDHSKASHRVRASLSRAASFTSSGERPEEAWTAAAQFDLAVASDDPVPAATRLQDAAAELAEGLAGQEQIIEVAMAEVIAAPRSAAAIIRAASVLGALGELRDVEHQRASTIGRGRPLGAKSTVAVRFAEHLEREADRLATIDAGANNRKLLDALEPDKQALIEALKGSNDALAATLEADWRSLERSATPERKQRLRNTLASARAWAQGASVGAPDQNDDLARLEDSGTAALTVLVAKHLDNSVARLSVEAEGSVTKNLRILQTAASQLRNLVDDDARTAQLASAASAAIAAAATDTPARATHLAAARTALSAIRRRAEVLVPTPPNVPPKLLPGINAERRLAALCAVALVFRTANPSDVATRAALYKAQFVSALDAIRATDSVRDSAVTAVDGALGTLATNTTPAAKAVAVQVLVRELDRLVDVFASLASSGLPTVAALIGATLIGVSPSDDGPTRLLRAQAHLRANASVISQSVLTQLAQRSDIEGLLLGLLGLLERLGRGEQPHVPTLDAPVYDRRLASADGIFAANPTGRVRIADNRVHRAVRGLASSGQFGHPLVGTPNSETGVVMHVDGNSFDGCAIGGLDLHTEGDAALYVSGNSVFASAGVAAPSPGDRGQAVVSIRGRGQLVVDGNSLQGNGHEHPRALVHELAIDWVGETVVRGNTLRHTGGGAGGAGLLVVVEAASDALTRSLAAAPFLGVEPPPKRSLEATAPPIKAALAIPTLLDAAIGAVTTASDSRKSRDGRLAQTVSTMRVAPRVVTRVAPARPGGVASSTAARYLARTTSSPLRKLLDFVRPGPYWRPSPLPPPPEQRTLHVEGNDVAARGPALLLVAAQNGDVISTSVVGNGLHSEGGTGAVYVRFAESVVFAGNRCQSPDAVNVVVIRALDSAVSVTGNVVVGREPVSPVTPPPLSKPKPPALGGASLSLSLGAGADIRIPVDAAKLRGSLDAFSSEAQLAFSNVLIARAASEEPFVAPLTLKEVAVEAGAPRVDTARAATSVRSARVAIDSTSFAEVLDSGAAKYALSPFTQPQRGSDVIKYIRDNELSSRDAEALIRGTELVAFESDEARNTFVKDVDLYRKTKKLEELATAKNVDSAVAQAEAGRVFQRVASKGDTQAGAVAEMTKLFTAQGFDAARTTAEVQALVDQSSGDAVKALEVLKTDIIGADAATVNTRKVIDNVGLLEKVLIDGLVRGVDAVAEPNVDAEEERKPRLPSPYDYSLVVLGGAAVAAVGNVTTADTLVLDASEAVELNT